MRFKRLVILELAPRRYGKNSWWLCQCDCGNKVIVCSSDLKKLSTLSCGCLRKEATHATTHGLSKTRFYRIFKDMRDRCNQPKNASYVRYGNKGIRCLWKSFGDFKNDMYESYIQHVKDFGEKQTQIDRINSKDNYYKSNCRWVTPKENALNRSTTKHGT